MTVALILVYTHGAMFTAGVAIGMPHPKWEPHSTPTVRAITSVVAAVFWPIGFAWLIVESIRDVVRRVAR